MIRRVFWLAMGATIGALIVRKLNRAVDALTPANVAKSAGSALSELSEAARSFALDVRSAMQEREDALRDGAGFDGTLGKVEPGDNLQSADG